MQLIMVGTLSLYEIFAYFFIYSFFGWIVEVAFHAVTTGKFINRGFLNGPVCLIYGVGVTAILLMLGELIEKAWVVALVGLAFPTFIELITGFVLDKLFHNKWWDYSDRKFNFKGYICLSFSLLWCMAVVVVIEVFHPAVKWFAALANEIVGTVLVCLCGAILIADMIITVLQILNLNKKLKEIDGIAKAMRIGSDFIGKGVANATLKAHDGVEHAKQKRNEAIDAVVKKMPKRLLKAFPRLASRTDPDSVALAKDSMERLKTAKTDAKQINDAPTSTPDANDVDANAKD